MTTNINSYILGTATVQNTNLHNNVFGSVSGTAVEGDTQITITTSGDLSGGGTLTLGSGGNLTLSYTGPTNVSAFTNDSGYITSSAIPTNVSAFTNDSGYLTSFTETDPTVPTHVKNITAVNINNWNTAHGWGDHSVAGYIKNISSFSTSDLAEGTNLYFTNARVDARIPTNISAFTNDAGYITTFTDNYADSVSFNTTNGVLTIGRTGALSDLTVDLDGRYQLTGTFAETDTLDSVTSRGNTTTNDITVNDIIVSGNLTVQGTTTTINAAELHIEDNLIYLNEGSTITNPDLGWSGNYNDGTYAHAGMFRDATDGRFKAFEGYTPEPGQTIDTSHASFSLADIQANMFYGNLTGSVTGTVSSIANHSTTNLSEGTNLYYTDARVDARIPTNVSAFTNDAGYLTSYTDTNTYVSSASFNTSNGVLTLTKSDTSTVTVDLDGRFTDNANADAMNQGVATTDSPTFVDVTATNFNGTATTAKYADLAEKYTTETEHPVGTVMMVSFNDDFETAPVVNFGIPVGVISEKPAFLMNEELDGQALALKGRVPVRVHGPIRKGEAVYVYKDGQASKQYNGAEIVGIALETNIFDGEKLVECVLKL